MGRGLSDQQRAILRLANQNRTARGLTLPLYRVTAIAEGDNGRARLCAGLAEWYDVPCWQGGLKPQYSGLTLPPFDTLARAETAVRAIEAIGFRSWLRAEAPAAHITVSEVLCDVYGLYEYLLPSVKRPICFEVFNHYYTLFDTQKIGKARKNAISVATSKALRRLCERKLLIYVRVPTGKSTGYALTEYGTEAAVRLSANTDDNVMTFSHYDKANG